MRNYKKEYANYHSKPEQRKKRSNRNKARRLMIKAKGSAAVAGKDVDHKDRNANNNATSNLRIASRSQNRSRNG
ncbi:MAG: HNH endonuclease [Flavobacteriia bacterium]|nr:HNH endonuclease [Flavobacteriia bacterium]